MDQELYQLVYDAKRGNIEAFTQLVKRSKGSVYRQALAMVNDATEAEDIVQEAFVKAYFSLAKLESEYAFAAWLTRIVSRLCHDRVQKRKREQQLTRKNLDELIPAPDASHGSAEQMQWQINIRGALQKLSVEHREVIVLRDIQGFSYDEMSNILQIPAGTIKSRLHAARLALRNELAQ